MFGRIYYYDQKKIQEYMSVLQGKRGINLEHITVTDDKNIGVNISALKLGKNAAITSEGTYVNSRMLELSEFTKALSESNEYYVDFLDQSSDEQYVVRGCILRFESQFRIPEEFNNIQLLADSKEFGKKKIEEGINQGDLDLFRTNFSMKDPKTPIVLTLGERIAVGKINSEFCAEDISDFEREDLTFLTRVVAPSRVKEREIFDPLKDFFSVSRGIRKNKDFKLDNMPKELQKIYVDREYIELEILAIYQ